MSPRVLIFALVMLVPVAALAAVRTFTDYQGNTIKAEFTGVKDGMVVLKDKTSRKQVPLAALSLEDREHIIELLHEKKQGDRILELMVYARNTTIARKEESESSGTNNAGGTTSGGNPGANYGTTPGANPGTRPPSFGTNPPATTTGPTYSTTTPGGGNAQQNAPVGLELTEMYEISLPTDELLNPARSRTWTDLVDQSMIGTFDRVVVPGLVILKAAGGAEQRIPLVNLALEDVEYIKGLVKADLETVVFPEGSYPEPTPQERASGLRKFRDRRGVSLVGRYKGRAGKDAIVEVAGIEQMYPYRGFSREDRQFLDDEDKRRETEQQRASATQSPSTASPSGASPGAYDPATAGAGGSTTPPPGGYGSNSTAGGYGANSGAGGYGANPGAGSGAATPSTPQFNAPSAPVYQFRCDRCGHSWTREGVAIDQCPRCNSGGGGNNSANASASGNTGGFSNYRAGRAIGKIIALVLALCGIGFGVNKARQ